jgi:hypothetical protein
MSYVPPLVIAAAGAVAPAPPSPERPGVNVWRNKRGGIVATGFTEGGVHWMHWPYLAAYRFAPGDPSITAYPAPNAPLDVLEDTYRRSVVLFETAARPFNSRRLPFDIRLRPRSSAFFDANAPRDDQDALALPVRAPISALCLLTRADRPAVSPVDVRRLDPVLAFSWLLAHAHCFNPHDDTRRATMLQHYLDVTALVPVYEIEFLASLDLLPIVLDRIVEALTGVTPTPEEHLPKAPR